MPPETLRGRENRRLPTHLGPTPLRGGGGTAPSPELLLGRGETTAPSATAATTATTSPSPSTRGGLSPPAEGEGGACTWACAWLCPERGACSCQAAEAPACALPRLQRARPEPRWSVSDGDRALSL